MNFNDYSRWHLLVQSQRGKHQNDVSDTSDFTYCAGVSVGDFEQVNAGWEFTFQVVCETQLQGIDLINCLF